MQSFHCGLEAVFHQQRDDIGAFVDVLGRQIAIWPTYFLPPIGFALAALIVLIRTLLSVKGPKTK